MSGHEPMALYQVRHPGGKDGFYRAACTCGYLSGFFAYPGHAQNARDQHIKAKVGTS
jgi:hypothetical protein